MTRYHRQADMPFGMKQFGRWLQPCPRSISPTDIDGSIHNRLDDTFLFFEFKPVAACISHGQDEHLKALSTRPGVRVWVIEDPTSDRQLDEDIDPLVAVRLRQYLAGRKVPPIVISVADLNHWIQEWLSGRKPMPEAA